MEPPTALEPVPISEEKNKVFAACCRFNLQMWVRGQYTGYRGSRASIRNRRRKLIALKCSIDNWRWAGVPFFLRTGKRWPRASASFRLRSASRPRACFLRIPGVGAQGPDHLTFDLGGFLQDVVVVLTASDRARVCGWTNSACQFAMHDTGFIGDVLEAYERLILDRHARRSPRCSTRRKALSACGKCPPPCWKGAPPVRLYAPGSWGPTRFTNSSPRGPGDCRSSAFGGILTSWGARRRPRPVRPSLTSFRVPCHSCTSREAPAGSSSRGQRTVTVAVV